MLGYKEFEEKMSYDVSVTHPNDALCDKNNEIIKTIDNNKDNEIIKSYETLVTYHNETSQNVSKTHYETKKKRGLFGRVLNAVFNED